MRDSSPEGPAALAGDCGTAWWQALPQAGRLPLLQKLVSRFNHDLRTPLNTLTGWTHLLQRAAGDAARTQHGTEVIARNVRDQTTLLQEFTADASALLDTLVLQPADVVAADLLAAALSRLEPTLSLHEIRIDIDDGAPGARIMADAAHTSRLLYRLLLLAVRRAPMDSVMRPRVQRVNGHVSFTLDSTAAGDSFDEAQLLDLRISSAIAHVAGAVLDVFEPAGNTRFGLRFAALP